MTKELFIMKISLLYIYLQNMDGLIKHVIKELKKHQHLII